MTISETKLQKIARRFYDTDPARHDELEDLYWFLDQVLNTPGEALQRLLDSAASDGQDGATTNKE